MKRLLLMSAMIAVVLPTLGSSSANAEPNWLRRLHKPPAHVQSVVESTAGRISLDIPSLTGGLGIGNDDFSGFVGARQGVITDISGENNAGQRFELRAAPGAGIEYDVKVPPEWVAKVQVLANRGLSKIHIRNIRTTPNPGALLEVPDPRNDR